jgi:hypothetical protein
VNSVESGITVPAAIVSLCAVAVGFAGKAIPFLRPPAPERGFLFSRRLLLDRRLS